MRLRGPARLLAVALFASLLSPVVLRPSPALAHGPCNATSDSGTNDGVGDFYLTGAGSPLSDGESVRLRVVRPNGGGSCPAKPSTGWPMVIFFHGGAGNRCEHDFYTKTEFATHGYAVLTFTARGHPVPLTAGSNPSGVSGCTQSTDAEDYLDDDGGDLGARERLDMSQLIDWVRDSYRPSSGCNNPCVDTDKVGVTGGSYGGFRSWLVGVPSPTNPNFDSRIKAIAPTWAWMPWQNVKALSNDGATPTSNFRQVSHSAFANEYLYARHFGRGGHYNAAVLQHNVDRLRARYLPDRYSMTQATIDYWNTRVFVDDDDAVDKVHLWTLPTFVIAGWLDGTVSIFNQLQIEAYNKLPGTDKYMYLGSCSHSPDPCHENNRVKMRDALHRFFDRYVRGDTTVYVRPPGTTTCSTTGPCVIYTIPPKFTSSTSNPWLPTGQTWTEQSSTTWPPSSPTVVPLYFRNNGQLLTTAETTSGCTPGSPGALGTGCSEFDNLAGYPATVDFCLGSLYGSPYGTYGSSEAVSYDTEAFGSDTKMIKVEADLVVSSTDTTRLQVNVDLFDVNSSGTELSRIWQGTGQVIPVKRDVVAGTRYRFKFVPGGAAWTVASGHLVRVKVTSKYTINSLAEPLSGKYRLWHNSTSDQQSKVTLTFVS